jgi:predicted ATP-binding protein involved in virulence
MTDKWHGGKGSRYRKIDQDKYNENWERVFGKKDNINSTSDIEDVLDGEEENTEAERETDT